MAVSNYRVIGRRLPKIGALEMVRGEAQYGGDLYLPGMLYAKVLRSPYARAKIRRIDASKALALEGVRGIITGRDLPNVREGTSFPMGEVPIELSGIAQLGMARDEVWFHGQGVAAVAAIDPMIAEEALHLIEVEYEELPPVLDIDQAMRPDAPVVDPNLRTKDMLNRSISDKPTNVAMKIDLARGDVDKGFREAEVVVQETYFIGQAHQGYIEPQACVARAEPDGRAVLWTSSQGSFTIQRQVAAIFDLPLNKVRVIPMEVGGAFGGKIYSLIEPTALALAQKTGRPIKLVLNREEVLRATGPGSPGTIKVKSGCRRDGSITAIECWMAFDAGCLPGSPVGAAAQTCLAPYGKAPNIRVEAYDVVTNKPRVTAYRAPGAPQAAFAVEQNIDAMAKAIGMDPIEFRLKNASEEGDPQANSHPFEQIGLRQVLEAMSDHPHYKSKLEGQNRGRGVAVGFWAGAGFTSSATVMIKPDGTASIVTGTVDLTGTRTAIQQICAEELGLEPEQVDVSIADTETAGYADVSGGSRITYTMSIAISKACRDALEQLEARAARRLRVEPEQIERERDAFFVKGDRTQSVTMAELASRGDGHVAGRSSITQRAQAPAFAGHIADVEVDPATGKTKVLRYTTFQDVGLTVNPTRVEAQMQGGAVQGIGWALTEEYVFDDKGVLRNASLLDYRQPVALDVPMIDTAIVEVPAPHGPHGIRGVGEAPIVPPPATLANAIHSAVGVRTNRMPMTPERVFWAMRSNR